MARRISLVLAISLLAVAFMAMTAAATSKPLEADQGLGDRELYKVRQYSFPYPNEHDFTVSQDMRVPEQPLGNATASGSRAPSPGVKVGDTWYDYQHNGTMGRMIDWGYDATNGLSIQFSWMDLPTSALVDRAAAFNGYSCSDGTFAYGSDGKPIQGSGDYAGYVGIDVTDDNRAVVGCHNDQGGGYASQFYYDYGPLWGTFSANSRVDDDCIEAGTEVIWPKFRYQETGPTEITHVIAQSSEANAGDPQLIAYFRKVGKDDAGTWVCPPYIIDTIYDLSQDIACSNTDGKVALVWTGNLCPDLSVCDTCSGEMPYVQLDNDIYYQISNDYGASWQPRVNLTKNKDGEAGYRPYTDLSALITTDNDLHIGWSGRVWPADANSGGDITIYCRMFHWGENNGFNTDHSDGLPRGNIRTVANLDWS
ncbi:MAG: hypothetical protein U9R56_03700, partial [candidate division Zixibacteria bacterium]|nr:hypothetical protein [candidate division Zixibacteria bacterium]